MKRRVAKCASNGYVAETLTVRLGGDLFNRARCRPCYFSDDYARALASVEGRDVKATAVFVGRTGLAGAYNIEIGGKLYHCPARFVECEVTP